MKNFTKSFLNILIIFIISYSSDLSAQTKNNYTSSSTSQSNSQELFYIGNWGATSAGNSWPILNNSRIIDGNASMGDKGGPRNGWATIRGGFDYDVEATTDSAIIIKGKLEFIGNDLNPFIFRYALTSQDSGTLQYQYTDSVIWVSTKGHYGYEFIHPVSFEPNPSRQSTVWTIVDGNWNSIHSNNGWSISDIYPSPPGAHIVEGVYNWAISIQQYMILTLQDLIYQK